MPERYNQSGFYWSKRQWVASAGRYASLHLASRQITTPAPHHSVFLQAGCPSCRPTNSVKALKAQWDTKRYEIPSLQKSKPFRWAKVLGWLNVSLMPYSLFGVISRVRLSVGVRTLNSLPHSSLIAGRVAAVYQLTAQLDCEWPAALIDKIQMSVNIAGACRNCSLLTSLRHNSLPNLLISGIRTTVQITQSGGTAQRLLLCDDNIRPTQV